MVTFYAVHKKAAFKRKNPYQEGDQSLQGLRIFFFVSSVTPKLYYTIRLWLNEAMIYHLNQCLYQVVG